MASISHLASSILPRKPSILPALAKPSIPAIRFCCVWAPAWPASLRGAGRRAAAGVVRAEAQAGLIAGAERRLYVGNIPRSVTNEELAEIFSLHGTVEKAEVIYDKRAKRSRRFGFVTMATVEDANVAAKKLDRTDIGGCTIKVNISEKPLQVVDPSLLQAEESSFVDSPYKVYVGNLAKTVDAEVLRNFFAEKGKVLGAKVLRALGTSKSNGFGFVSFLSEEEAEAAISSMNNQILEGQTIRVSKA